jgi:hypothetical protein
MSMNGWIDIYIHPNPIHSFCLDDDDDDKGDLISINTDTNYEREMFNIWARLLLLLVLKVEDEK